MVARYDHFCIIAQKLTTFIELKLCLPIFVKLTTLRELVFSSLYFAHITYFKCMVEMIRYQSLGGSTDYYYLSRLKCSLCNCFVDITVTLI